MGLGRLRQEKDEHEMHGSSVESYIYVVNHRFLSDLFPQTLIQSFNSFPTSIPLCLD